MTSKRPEGTKPSRSSTNVNMTFRKIGRMGQSMSSMVPNKKPSESDELDMDFTPLPTIRIPQERIEAAEKHLLADIREVRLAMDLFLNSRIPESEQILEPKKDSTLYHSLGHSFVLFLRSVMTFQKEDIEAAILALKKTIQLADAFRKKSGWLGNITTWVKGLDVLDIWNMSRLQRHAELIYAESYLLKALLCIIHDESIVSFLREGLHVRSSYYTYKVLKKFLHYVQEQAISGKDVSSCEIDDHFTSGVSLGVGLFNLIISLLPHSVMKLVEFIGFASDHAYGMEILETAGGWEEYAGLAPSELPPPQGPDEGLRRQFCDMALLFYHIILPKLIPISDVNTELSDRILAYSLKMYPNGVFYLFFSGRQLAALRKLDEAKVQYQRAIDMQKDWKQLQHMCYWELGLTSLLKLDYQSAYDCYTILQRESNWSKAVYYYLQAISLYCLSISTEKTPEEQEKLAKEAGAMMQKVTGAKQKIAGKSIPLEKFVARKARKFVSQNNRLLFPDLEAVNAFSIFELQPNDVLYKNLDRTNNEINRLLNEVKHEEVLNYYDDICLSHYMRSMVLRLLLENEKNLTKEKAAEYKQLHQQSIQFVLDNANKIQLDHYIYYFTRYEQARMLIFKKQYNEAEEIVKTVIKAGDKGHYGIGAGSKAKNKYSQENTLLFKCHNCITEIKSLAKSSSSSSVVSSSDESFSSAEESIHD